MLKPLLAPSKAAPIVAVIVHEIRLPMTAMAMLMGKNQRILMPPLA